MSDQFCWLLYHRLKVYIVSIVDFIHIIIHQRQDRLILRCTTIEDEMSCFQQPSCGAPQNEQIWQGGDLSFMPKLLICWEKTEPKRIVAVKGKSQESLP